MRNRVRSSAPALLATAVLAAMLAACAPPTATTVGLGEHRGYVSPVAAVTLYYQGQEGERLNVAANDGHGRRHFDVSIGHPLVFVELLGPNGESMQDHQVRDGDFGATYDLPADGRYRVRLSYHDFDPSPIPYTVWLSHDEHGGVAQHGALAEGVPGQYINYDYVGHAGEHLNVMQVNVFDPDGAWVPLNGRRSLQVTLPEDGTYRLEVTGLFAKISNDVDGGEIDLGAHVRTGLLPRQHIDFRYAGHAGEELFRSSRGTIGVVIYDPAGNEVFRTQPLTTPSARYVLPADGTYTVSAEVGDVSNAVELILTGALDAGPLPIGDSAAPTRLPGQPLRYTYQATAGEMLWLTTSLPTTETERFVFRRPDGTVVLRTSQIVDGVEWLGYPFDVTGEYRLQYWTAAEPAPFTVSTRLDT
jgi:hypothetical protein